MGEEQTSFSAFKSMMPPSGDSLFHRFHPHKEISMFRALHHAKIVWSAVALLGLLAALAWLLSPPPLRAAEPALPGIAPSLPQALVPLDGIIQVAAGEIYTFTNSIAIAETHQSITESGNLLVVSFLDSSSNALGQSHLPDARSNSVLEMTLMVGETGSTEFQLCHLSGNRPISWVINVPQVNWVSFIPTSGQLAPTECDPITATFNAAGLEEGVYDTVITFTHNADNNPSLPVVLTVLPWAEVEVKIRAFIPCGAVNDPFGGLFGGDNRSFSYNGGLSRFVETVIVTTNPMEDEPLIERPAERVWMSTTKYDSSNDGGQQSGSGNADWCRQLVTNPTTPDTGLANDGSRDRPAFSYQNPSGRVDTNFVMEAGNPFYIHLPPKLDADIVVFLRQTREEEPEYIIDGTHDGFPAYEIYLDGKLVYCHDPIASGNSPASLFGGFGLGGTKVNSGDWKPIEPITCRPIKGIQVNSPTGDRGSAVTVTGNGFILPRSVNESEGQTTDASTIDIYINDLFLGSIEPDGSGKFQVTLDTSQASYGFYQVSAKEAGGEIFYTEFQVEEGSFIIEPLNGVDTSFTIPPNISTELFDVFLPAIQR